MKTFKQFVLEQQGKTAVIAYGRYNPPTVGHEKLISKLAEVTNRVNGDGFLVPSHTQNNKKDPLSFKEKEEILKYMTPPKMNTSAASVPTIAKKIVTNSSCLGSGVVAGAAVVLRTSWVQRRTSEREK